MRGDSMMSAQNPESEKLHRLFKEEWDYQMEQEPTWASMLGDRRWNDQWPDASPDAFNRRHLHDHEVLRRIDGFDRAQLTPPDILNLDLFRDEYARRIEGHPFNWHLIAVNQRGGVQTEDELAENLRFDTLQDYEDWLGRLRNLPAYVDQNIELLREGIRQGMVLPKVVMQRVPEQIDKQIVHNADESGYFRPFKQFPESIPASESTHFIERARSAIASGVVPAYQRFGEFFTREYLPACYDEVGAWRMSDGERMYAYLCRKFTTTELTPQEIHDTGLREVANIREEMEKIKTETGFRGSLKEFFQFLRTDPQFYCASPQELLDTYRAVSKRIDPALVKLFRKLPRTPYGVTPIPEAVAPDTTTAYYMPPADDGSRAGLYYVNLYKPETRPKWEMMALSLHEAVPGHHLQIALAQEQGELPDFRRHAHYTGYLEGWALYAESLGEEMGLYDDPYSKFGRLTYDMWRAVRLVVDTGIHAFRWDRQKAIDYFLDNAAKNELDVVNEIDRYIAWPGQAVAYKIGELKMWELRRAAEQALGARFDLRDFHAVVLDSGAIPLSLLDGNVRSWIRSGQSVAN